MKRFTGFILILFCLTLTSSSLAFEDSSLAIGDLILVVNGILSVHTQPDDTSPIVTEILPGMKSLVLSIQTDSSDQTWFYLENNAYGWVRSTNDKGMATMDRFSDDRLQKLQQDADIALKADSSNQYAYITRATVFLTLHDYEQAETNYQNALQLDPENGALNEYLGKAYMDAGQYNQALTYYETTINTPSLTAGTYNRLGIVHLLENDYDQAITYYQQAIQRVPDWGLVYSNLAYAYRKKQDYNKGLDYINQALEHDPLLAIAYNAQGWIYRALDDASAAEESFKNALAINPKNANAYIGLGILYNDVYRDYETALADYKTAIELEPDNDWAYTARAVTYMYTGNTEGAIADLKHALTLNPNNDSTRYNLAALYGNLGRYHEALNSYNEAINMVGSDYDKSALLYRPQIYIALGDYQSAMDDLDNYIDWQSGRTGYFATVAYLIRGVTHFYRGEYILGVSDITMAYGFQPQFVLNYATYGAGYRITAQREYQIYDLQQQIKQNPKQADLYLQLANLDMEYGHWQEGIDNYRAYKDLMPNHELDYLVDALEVVLLNP